MTTLLMDNSSRPVRKDGSPNPRSANCNIGISGMYSIFRAEGNGPTNRVEGRLGRGRRCVQFDGQLLGSLERVVGDGARGTRHRHGDRPGPIERELFQF